MVTFLNKAKPMKKMIPVVSSQINIVAIVCLCLLLQILITGCSLDSPTYLSQKKVEIVEKQQKFTLETQKINEQSLKQIAAHYDRYGKGSAQISVTYNPISSENTAKKAIDNAAHIATTLRKQGIGDIKMESLPIHQSPVSMTYITYSSYHAQAPQECGFIENIDDTEHENYRDYQLGCSTESYIARQISRPADLLGRDSSSEETDARKRANAVEGYKWTNGNGLLEAPTTSD